MSVGLDPRKKYDIVCWFNNTNNKSATATEFGVSARTVGRVIDEYKDALRHVPYIKIVDNLKMIVCPEDIVQDTIAIHLSQCFVSFLEDNGFVGEAKKYINNLDGSTTFEELFSRVEETDTQPPELRHDEDGQEYYISGDDDPDPTVVDYGEDGYNYSIIASAKSIMISRLSSENNEIDSVQIPKGGDNFRKAWSIIRTVDFEDEEQINIAGSEIYTLANPKLAIEKFSQGKLTVDPAGELVFYGDYEIHNSLSNRIIKMIMERGVDGAKALINFLEKLMENPSYRAVNSLYEFLKHNDIEINDDGNFYAWKKVTADYLDVRTNSFDNSVGSEPSMPRNMVNENPNQTCESGLHVCAEHYLPSYPGEVVIKCEIDPVDVVAVPTDYNNAKMRVCRYKVIEDVSGRFLD